MDAMADQRAVVATVVGRVQGVGYRYATLGVAHELGLRGWVRNAPDGSVETWAQGNEANLEAFIAFLRQGPRSARVQSVDVRSVEPDGNVADFVVRS
jgi:acylphosphatase